MEENTIQISKVKDKILFLMIIMMTTLSWCCVQLKLLFKAKILIIAVIKNRHIYHNQSSDALDFEGLLMMIGSMLPRLLGSEILEL